MTLTSAWANGVPGLLLDSALRAVLLAATAGASLALFRVRSTSMRLFTWTGVLYVAIAMPLLTGLVPVVSVPLPSFGHEVTILASAKPLPRADATSSRLLTHLPIRETAAGTTSVARDTQELPQTIGGLEGYLSVLQAVQWLKTNWAPCATIAYVMVASILLGRIGVGIFFAKRLVSRSRIVDEPRVMRSAAAHLRSGIDRPQIYESDFVAVPVTVGTMRPVVLLPTGWRTWDDTKVKAVIAHELSHVIRRDALTQFVSRIHRAVFWFSPLPWWLDRKLSALAEQASDEAALSGGVDRTEYAKTLLGFFESLHATPGRVWWQGVSMATAGDAEHRLERILSWRGVVTMGAKKSVFVAIVALAVPAVYVVAAAHPAKARIATIQTWENPQEAPAAVAGIPPATAAPALVPIPPGAPGHGIAASGIAAPALPAAPAAPGISAAPAIAWSGQTHSYGTGNSKGGFSYAYGFDDEQRFVIVSGNSDSLTMSGSSEDARHVQRLKKQIPGDFIWFQRDEKSYIIRDQATIDRARKLWAPQEELGKKQEELGKQQEALGKQQEELGAKMEQVKVNVPDMTAEMDRLKAKLQKLGPTATMDQIGELQSEIGELQSKIGELQSHAGEQQSKFGEEMGALGEKQGKLGEQQGELGRQQGELAEKASKQMKELLDEAIKNGKAKPEPENNDGGTI